MPRELDKEALKPCPHCGGKADLLVGRASEDSMFAQVYCTGCPVETDEFEDACAPRGDAIAAWNRRVSSIAERAEGKGRESLTEIRRRVRNIWGAISSNQVIDKDAEGQAKKLLEYIDGLLSWPSQPANPAQLTDAMVEAVMPPIRQILADFAHDNRMASVWSLEAKIEAVLTAAIGADSAANPAREVTKLAHDPRCSVHKGQPCDFDCARDYPQRDALIAKLKAFVTAKEWWGEQAETLCRWAYEALERDAIGAGGQAVAEARKLLLWAADSFDARAKCTNVCDEIEGYEESAKMYRECASRLSSTSQPHPADERVVSCVACEDHPKAPNDPCAVCGRSTVADERVVEALRSLLTLTKFELAGNASRQPWARTIEKAEAALSAKDGQS